MSTGKVLIGRDATLYTIQKGVLDNIGTAEMNFGAAMNMIAVYKDIRINFKQDWIDVTPSSASMRERRRTVSDWEADLSNLVREDNGPIFLPLILESDYMCVFFTPDFGGGTIQMIGGMDNSTLANSREATSEDMKLICVLGDRIDNYGGLYWHPAA